MNTSMEKILNVFLETRSSRLVSEPVRVDIVSCFNFDKILTC